MRKINQETKNRVIDIYCPFSYLLKYSDYQNYKNLDGFAGTIFCPFHENFDTPSARLYPKSENQECEHIYCFSENKLYKPHDCCKDYSKLIKYDTNTVFSIIWEHLSDKEKEYFNENNEINKVEFSEHKHIFKEYRCGNICLFDLVESLFYNK